MNFSSSKSGNIIHWTRHEFHWALLSIIPLVALTIALLSSLNIGGLSTELPLKGKLEIAHPSILFAFILISLTGSFLKKHSESKWLALLGSAFFMREIHFEGSDYIMAIIILGIFTYAWRFPHKFSTLWDSPWTLSLIILCFTSYFCSEILFDRGLIKQPFEIIFNDPEWKLPHSSNIEETLETLGGLFLFSSGIHFTFLHQREDDTTTKKTTNP